MVKTVVVPKNEQRMNEYLKKIFEKKYAIASRIKAIEDSLLARMKEKKIKLIELDNFTIKYLISPTSSYITIAELKEVLESYGFKKSDIDKIVDKAKKKKKGPEKVRIVPDAEIKGYDPYSIP
jgi:hypothetical protein